jgi:hypothetical protein
MRMNWTLIVAVVVIVIGLGYLIMKRRGRM